MSLYRILLNSYHGAEKPGFAAVRRKSENPITSANIEKQIPSQPRYAAFWLSIMAQASQVGKTRSDLATLQLLLQSPPILFLAFFGIQT